MTGNVQGLPRHYGTRGGQMSRTVLFQPEEAPQTPQTQDHVAEVLLLGLKPGFPLR